MSGGIGIVETTLMTTEATEMAGAGQKLSCILRAKTYLLVGDPQELV